MLPPKKASKINPNSGSIAEQILQGMMTGDSKPQLSPGDLPSKATRLNIKDIKVPDSIVESIINFATDKEDAPEKKPEPVNEEVVIQNKMEDLIKRLSDLLKEAKQFVNEMTTTGMIGVGKVKPLGKKKGKKH